MNPNDMALVMTILYLLGKEQLVPSEVEDAYSRAQAQIQKAHQEKNEPKAPPEKPPRR